MSNNVIESIPELSTPEEYNNVINQPVNEVQTGIQPPEFNLYNGPSENMPVDLDESPVKGGKFILN